MSFFIQDLHLNFHTFLVFQHKSGSSVKTIMLLSATLPLFWFVIALLYQKSAIIGLSFLNPKDLCLPNQFSKTFYQYILNLMSKKKLGSFNDWINAYFQSFICLPRYEHFLPGIFSKVSLTLLKRIQPILEILIILGKYYKAMKILHHWQI